MATATQHAAFFAGLVELVPPKYYLHTDADHVNLKYMKKKDAQNAKANFKLQHKAAKRASLDPAKAKTTLDIQRDLEGKAVEEKASQAPSSNSAAAGRALGASLHLSAGKAPSRDDLRERLQKKLEVGEAAWSVAGWMCDYGCRSERKAKEEASTADQAKNWRDEALKSGRAKLEKRAPEAPAPGPTPPQKKAKTAAKPAAQQEVPLSNVNFGGKAAKAGKKLSKAQLLAKAEAKQGQQSTEVYDDPKLLKKSLKKEAKLKAKKSKAWQERVASQEEEKKQRQDKRKTNIQSRIQDTKNRKKDRREKKLMRPGFEGRKTGFITPGKAPPAK
ncbi:hypothetical protein QBZ16_002245 [Prototheca wickerhamii]|uniref:Uncharacterized protein n=1 Tax=Prototheca wickerhamii TaxID=3111 RepID=A0AAD9IN51_PROWI|nr:hypothetical protein QBZ16_002245 [Prototheca wickerhamii]